MIFIGERNVIYSAVRKRVLILNVLSMMCSSLYIPATIYILDGVVDFHVALGLGIIISVQTYAIIMPADTSGMFLYFAFLKPS
jgi:hypothetical protein